MVSIILTILKIIGISILVILGIIVLLILLVLFVPVRYRAYGSCTDKEIDVFGRVSWLIGIAAVTVRYKDKQPFRMRVRLFGIPIFDSRRERRHKKGRKSLREKPELQAASFSENASEEKSAVGESPAKEDIAKNAVKEEHIEEKDSKMLIQEPERASDEVESSNKMTICQKIKRFFLKFFEFFSNIKFTFRKICVTIIKIKDNIKYYWELLQQESTKQAFDVCKKQLLRIGKNLCPKKYRAKLHLGFEDPAVMGDVLAVWGMLYPFHKGRIEINPEFEKKIMEGSFQLKGRVSIYVFLWTVWLFLTDKNIRQLRKQLNI